MFVVLLCRSGSRREVICSDGKVEIAVYTVIVVVLEMGK